MTPAPRCICPDCGGSHTRRKTPTETVRRSSMAAHTDLDVTKCPSCRAPVLAGHIGGLHRLVDTDPLTEIGVAAYRSTDRALFTLTGTQGRTLSYAWRWPPRAGTTVHVEHQCGKPVPPALREKLITKKERSTEFPDNPPY